MADKIFIENVKVQDRGVELKTSNSGKEYAQFTAMWSSSRKDRNGQGKEFGPTKFVRVMVFGFQAGDIAANVKGGDRVTISGTIEHFEWQSNQGPKDDWTVFAESVSLPVPRAGMNEQVNQFTQQQGGQQQGGPWGGAPQGGFGDSAGDAPF